MAENAGSTRTLFWGISAFIGGAALFSLSTVLIKVISSPPYELNPIMAAFSRFFIGFLVSGFWALAHKSDLRARRVGLVIWRGVLNTLAIILFYGAVQFTTVTNTNMLNLTYPAWIFLTAPFVNGEKSPVYYFFFLVLMLVGAFLVVLPPGGPADIFRGGMNWGDIMALGSGVVAAFGISVLRQARKYDGTTVVLFYLFGIGTLVTLVPTLISWKTPPDPWSWFCLLSAGLCGFLGQALITWGYRFVTAAQGSLFSSSGVIIGALLGAVFFAEPLRPTVLVGGLLVLICLVGVSGIFEEARRRIGR